MMRKSLIAGLGLLGLVAASSMAGATPAAAGYACGHWNGWCSWYSWPANPYRGWQSHGYNRNHGYWNGHWHGNKHYYYKGKKKRHAHKKHKRYYH